VTKKNRLGQKTCVSYLPKCLIRNKKEEQNQAGTG